MKEFYLDSNAHSMMNLSFGQLSKLNFDIGIHGNPMSPNLIGRKASLIIENAREKIAEMLNAPNPECIYFTHSCTEANYWGLTLLSNEFFKSYDEDDDGCYFNISPYEHKSVEESIKLLPFAKNIIPLNKDGYISKIELYDYSVYVGVQSETGIIAEFDKIRTNTNRLFFSDLAQAVGKIDIDLQKMGIDIATFAPHKYGGMSGVGIMYLKDPAMYGELYTGGQYNKDIPGTPNVFGIAIAAIAMENILKKEIDSEFQMELENRLVDLGFEIVGAGGNRIKTTTLAKAPMDGLELLGRLSERNIFVGLGSACGSMTKQLAKAANALGYDGDNTSYIRISHNGEYGGYDAIYVADEIGKIIKEKNG
jgi:cysteine desulfurase